MSVLAIIVLFFVAGLVGGYAGYLQGPPNPDELPKEKRDSLRTRSLILGIVGAFLVPVFLTIVRATSGTDDDLIDQLASQEGGSSGWFVLFGFALLAAMSAQRLISNLTKALFDDVFERASAAERMAKAAKQDLEDLDEDMTEIALATTPRSRSKPQPLSNVAAQALETIDRIHDRRPSQDELAEAGRFDAEELDLALQELESRGFAQSKDYDGKRGWRVRPAGKALLATRPMTTQRDNDNHSE